MVGVPLHDAAEGATRRLVRPAEVDRPSVGDGTSDASTSRAPTTMTVG